MHEAALARQILRTALERARSARANRIVRISGWIAETERLSVDSLRLHFQAAGAGSPAAGAALDFLVVTIEARCRRCGASFTPDHHLVLCPRCGSADDADLSHPTGFAIDRLEVR